MTLDITPVPTPGRSARLSIAQKCDLAGQIVAAVITTGLIAAPFSKGTPVFEVLHPQSIVSFVEPAAVPVLSSPQLPPPSLPAPRRMRVARPRVALESRTVALMPSAIVAGTAGRIDPSPRKDAGRKTFGRRLAGLFIGSRDVPIRPFPTVPQQ